MEIRQYDLVDPPTEPRARELWLQHAAGFIIFEDARRYAMDLVDPGLDDDARAAAQKGIDDAIYGLMMIINGVTGSLRNQNHEVRIDFIARLLARSEAGEDQVLSDIDLRYGDGMCMGYHHWMAGNFGDDPVAVLHPNESLAAIPRKKQDGRKQDSKSQAEFLF